MFVRVLRFMSFVYFFACAVSATGSENVVRLDFSKLDFSKAVSHIVTGHVFCPPDVGKLCAVDYVPANEEYLNCQGGQDDDAVRVQCVEVKADHVISFGEGIKSKRFEVNTVVTDPNGLVYSRQNKDQKSLWNSIYQMIKGSISEIVKLGDVSYNIKLTKPIKVYTFIAVRYPGKKRPKTVMVKFQESLKDLISQTDTFCLVLKKNFQTVKTMYPVLPLMYLSPEDVAARVQSVGNPS